MLACNSWASNTDKDHWRESCFNYAIRESKPLISKRRQGALGWPCAWFLLTANSAMASAAVADDPACVEANRFLESAECINDRLPELNRLISEGYGALVTKLGRPIANRIQIPFMRMRLMCGADVRCEYRWQMSQLAAFYRVVPAGPRELLAVPALLQHQSLSEILKAGECSLFRAVEVSCGPEEASGGDCIPMLGGGSHIVLSDDLRGLSAEDIGAVASTRRGDPMLACKGAPAPRCAAGDTRGHFWTITNYRTGDSWQMADTVHTCLRDPKESGRN